MLKITVSDEFQNTATVEIALTAVAVYGLENLSQLQLKVDEEINLMQGLTIAEGLTLQKVEIVQDGIHTVIDNPNAYTPAYPGSIDIVLTLAKPDGSTIEVEAKNAIAPLPYHEATLEEATDFIARNYSYFNVLHQATKDFIIDYLKISHHACNRAHQDNLVYITL